MLASVDYKFVLLAQPKTGTTALHKGFRNFAQFKIGGAPKWKHVRYRQFKEIFGDYFENQGCDIFGVVRDPIDQMQSIYRFRTRDQIQSSRGTGHVSFQEFASAWASATPPSYTTYTTPSTFFADKDGNPAPISYYRYESLPALVDRLNTLCKAKVVLKQNNVSPKMELEFDRDALMKTDRMKAEYDFYNSLSFVA